MQALKLENLGHLGGSVIEHLPSAQVVILESWIESRIGLPAWSLLLPLLLPLPVSLLPFPSLCLS